MLMLRGLILIFLSLAGISCNQSVFNGLNTKRQNEAPPPPKTIDTEAQWVSKDLLTLNSLVVNAFVIDIEECVSGHQASLTETQPQASLYAKDKKCLGKLKSFTVDGVTYTPSGLAQDQFIDYQAGDTAVFHSEDGSAQLDVRVVAQLPADLSSAQGCLPITYAFGGIDAGNRGTIIPMGAGAAGHVVGDAIPPFEITEARLVGKVDGYGKFQFRLQCFDEITTDTCSDIIDRLEYVLIDDTTNGILTLHQAADFFKQATAYRPAVKSRRWFRTYDLPGPQPLQQTQSMILLLKNGDSYQYFEVPLNLGQPTPDQPGQVPSQNPSQSQGKDSPEQK